MLVTPLAPALLPLGGGGACDASVLPVPEFSVFCAPVIRHYRNRGASAAVRSPWSFPSFWMISPWKMERVKTACLAGKEMWGMRPGSPDPRHECRDRSI